MSPDGWGVLCALCVLNSLFPGAPSRCDLHTESHGGVLSTWRRQVATVQRSVESNVGAV